MAFPNIHCNLNLHCNLNFNGALPLLNLTYLHVIIDLDAMLAKSRSRTHAQYLIKGRKRRPVYTVLLSTRKRSPCAQIRLLVIRAL